MKREASPQEYLDAAGERRAEAVQLYQADLFGGAVYLAGVSVECALHAFLPSGHQWRGQHNLALIAADGLAQRLPSRRAKEIGRLLSDISVRWNNSQRYYPSALTERLVKGKVRNFRDAKGNAKFLVDCAYELYSQALVVWRNPDDFVDVRATAW